MILSRALRAALFRAALGFVAVFVGAARADTLDAVLSRGVLVCGVNTGLAGFGLPDDRGVWRGFDIDYCRAVAAAIFDDPQKVRFTPLSGKDRFTALQSGEIDLLSRNTTWTQSREAGQGLLFAGINYFDGQGFLVHKGRAKTVRDLKGASICVQQGTTTELNLADAFRKNGISAETVVFTAGDEALKAYESGRCDAYTTDGSALYAQRLKLSAPDDHEILDEVISKEPFGPVVRQGDDRWFNLVKWTHFALLDAEELGVSAANVEELRQTSHIPEIRRLLGADNDFGAGLGLSKDWAVRIIRAVGNYGEIFERNLGQGSPLKIPRGRNAQWREGGLHYAPPVR